MSNELQVEELEVLDSIYDGDPNFKKTLPITGSPILQYKVNGETDSKSFLLELSWEENYPDVKPCFNLDAFYNKHLTQTTKDEIISRLNEEAEQYLGTSMTFTLIEWAKENVSDLLINSVVEETNSSQEITSPEKSQLQETSIVDAAPKLKKNNLSKQQKRKLYDQTNARGEKPRGWDWVDVIKHLSQSGGKANSPVDQTDT